MKVRNIVAGMALAVCIAFCGCSKKVEADKVADVPSSEAADAQATADSEFTVIDFNATWCGPCKQFAPIFEQVAEEFAGKAKFESIDIDENPDLAEKYNVRAIPCIVILKGDTVVAAQTGAVDYETFKALVSATLAK